MIWNTEGYHGTDPVAAEQILSQKKFLPTREEDAWLGEGVYFFIDDSDACWWCEKNKRIKKYAVLKAEITPNTVIDLVASKEDSDHFKLACDMVKGKCSKVSSGRPRKNYMSLAINHMLKAAPKPDAIIGGFQENREMYYNYEEVLKFPFKPLQIQICVINHECISGVCLHKGVE